MMTKLQALEKEAASLPEEDRAALVAVLLSTFDAPPYDVDDDEVVRRDEEMETGKEAGISHEDFVRTVRPTQPE